jgi:hypothetical protein
MGGLNTLLLASRLVLGACGTRSGLLVEGRDAATDSALRDTNADVRTPDAGERIGL